MRVYSYIHQTFSILMFLACIVLAVWAFAAGQIEYTIIFLLNLITFGIHAYIPVLWRKTWW